MFRNLRRVGFALALIVGASLIVLAQGTTSRVTGVVTDAAGAPVQGATVTLRNEGTGATLTMETSDSGSYTFDLVQPGTYEVTVERTGFKKFVSQHNQAVVNQPATVNVSLQAGDVSATVTVTCSAERCRRARPETLVRPSISEASLRCLSLAYADEIRSISLTFSPA